MDPCRSGQVIGPSEHARDRGLVTPKLGLVQGSSTKLPSLDIRWKAESYLPAPQSTEHVRLSTEHVRLSTECVCVVQGKSQSPWLTLCADAGEAQQRP